MATPGAVAVVAEVPVAGRVAPVAAAVVAAVALAAALILADGPKILVAVTGVDFEDPAVLPLSA
jgi:hypothetical protein